MALGGCGPHKMLQQRTTSAARRVALLPQPASRGKLIISHVATKPAPNAPQQAKTLTKKVDGASTDLAVLYARLAKVRFCCSIVVDMEQ